MRSRTWNALGEANAVGTTWPGVMATGAAMTVGSTVIEIAVGAAAVVLVARTGVA
eukprot:CAMPEP_0196659116 /NCGR_PEP_ID=MMETSP1086-20130531/33180_1 /TAXON_ID=77921 /ORGANISM="Cyanoptyche  gloeocystis , Strain SAG4.97" /LENGTH=54 /DNA_ID=CAMNT_0041992965 /DNA_START=110 /DNA_END=271 /DNA_ORIENTATION=+